MNQPRRRNTVATLWIAATLIALLSASKACAETFTKTMATGSKLKIAGYHDLHQDCSSIGKTVVRILNSPNHGTVTVATGVTYPHYASANPHNVCNTRQVPSTNVEYVAEKGFLGTDYVTIEAIYPDGGDRTDTYEIIVK